MIDIVNQALNYASAKKITCHVTFDNGIFTLSDKTRVPDTCVIEPVKVNSRINDPNAFWVFRLFGNMKTLTGTIYTDKFDYSQTLEITRKSIKIGCISIEFYNFIW